MTTKNQIFTSVLSGSPLITSEKLFGSENYLSWSASVELWFMGQGYEDHLVTQEADIPEVDRVQWRKIDAQLCSVLWQSVDPRILLHLQAYKTCFKFWTQAKGLYTNDIQRLYKVASAIVHLSQQDLDLSTYIGQIASLKKQFLTVMPLTPDVGAQQTQLDKFFMVLTLIGLRPDLEPIRDQILGSSSVPSLDDVFARLLRISSTQTLPSDSASDSSVLVSQTTSRGGRSGTRGRGQRPHCTYCNKLGHTRDRCYQLHGRPPRTAHMAQSSDSPLPQTPSSSASQTSQASIASVAQPGNASACLTHTSSLGPWILDSGASDHLSGNKDLFSSITTTSDLPTVTLANGSQTVAKEAWLVELWDHSGDEGVWNPSFSRMLWKETKDGIFSVKSLYSSLASRKDVQFPYSNIWSTCVPTKCSKARGLWELLFALFGVTWVLPSSVRDTLSGWSGFKGKKRRKVWNAAPLCIFWAVWKERNRIAFDNEELSIHRLKNSFVCNLWLWTKSVVNDGPLPLINFFDWLGAS
ncbi:hypothetical protein CK203_075425 [Vitis vinifera]|uniref:Retrovirus-related Pol polyprotein from transposon TNT 1-94-like beta-barrel domain-containing protein n=1 Tax=Vitis vinifera TaxID=29760 RepID=A0A438EU79_VITVI|nr:hypothetical protein CK203_075425 [Vitis vinifera]